jgi:hypothetical protein
MQESTLEAIEGMKKRMRDMYKHQKCTWDELFVMMRDNGCRVSRGTFDNWVYGRTHITNHGLKEDFEAAYTAIMK